MAPAPDNEGIIIRVGILGAGHGGLAMLKVLKDLPKIRIVGICDVDHHAPAIQEARRIGIPVFPTLNALVTDNPIDWLINLSHSSITQRHLLEREMDYRINIIDGAAAEVVWRFLTNFHQMMEICPEKERGCVYDMVWSFITSISDPVRDVQDRLNAIAFHDPLTGLYTRRILLEFLEQKIRNTFREPKPLSVLLADVDRFKSVNDTFGHPEGDKVLKNLAFIMKNNHRPSDLVARMGGEEFVAVLPGTYLEDAREIAERLRRSVAREMVRPDGEPLTISIGVATLNVEDPVPQRMTHERLLDCADRALYRAKELGRNRVVVFEPNWERVVE